MRKVVHLIRLNAAVHKKKGCLWLKKAQKRLHEVKACSELGGGAGAVRA